MMTLTDAKDWYVRRQLPDGDPKTIKLYEQAVARVDRFLGRPALAEDLTDDLLAEVVAAMRTQGLAPRTCNKFLENACSLWRFLADENVVTKRPRVKKMRVPERIPFAWSPEQLGAILRAARDTRYTISGTPSAIWWDALVSTCYDTAERIDGVLSLRWIDMEWDTSSMIIKAEGRKGSRADRRYVVHPTTLATLSRIAKAGPLVFTWDRSRTSMWDHYRRILEAAGLPTGRETMFHALRKTHATELHAAGGDATASLDHADARTTRRYLGQRAKPATQVDLLPRPVTLRLFVGDEQHSA